MVSYFLFIVDKIKLFVSEPLRNAPEQKKLPRQKKKLFPQFPRRVRVSRRADRSKHLDTIMHNQSETL